MFKTILRGLYRLPKCTYQKFKATQIAKKHYETHYPGKTIALLHNHTFGPLCMCFKMNLRDCLVQKLDPHQDVVFIAGEKSVNPSLQAILSRHANIVVDPLFFQALLNGGIDHFVKTNKGLPADYKNGRIHHPEHPISITPNAEDHKKGALLLQKLGLTTTDKVILVHNKDQTYYQQRGLQKPWDSYRDSSFSSLIPTLTWLTEQGYKIIRMGHYEEEPGPYISLNKLPRALRDFSDFYLTSICTFCLYGASGIAHMAYLLDIPLCLHDFIPIAENVPLEKGQFLPKKLMRRHEKKLHSISEIRQKKQLYFNYINNRPTIEWVSSDHFQDYALYEQHKIDIEDNTSDEILQFVKDFIQLTLLQEPLSEEDQVLQKKFKESFPNQHPMRDMIGLIAPHFLRQNQDLLP